MTTKRKCRAGTNEWLRILYAELNEGFFDNKLPHDLEFRWRELQRNITAHVLWQRRDTVSPYVPYLLEIDTSMRTVKLQKKVGMSMLHEMVHIKLGPEIACEEWDGEFDQEMFKLAAAGAFRLFW